MFTNCTFYNVCIPSHQPWKRIKLLIVVAVNLDDLGNGVKPVGQPTKF